jgi:hypothetical protein
LVDCQIFVHILDTFRRMSYLMYHIYTLRFKCINLRYDCLNNLKVLIKGQHCFQKFGQISIQVNVILKAFVKISWKLVKANLSYRTTFEKMSNFPWIKSQNSGTTKSQGSFLPSFIENWKFFQMSYHNSILL